MPRSHPLPIGRVRPRYQIREGILFRQEECVDTGRCRGVEKALHRLLKAAGPRASKSCTFRRRSTPRLSPRNAADSRTQSRCALAPRALPPTEAPRGPSTTHFVRGTFFLAGGEGVP